MKEIKDYLNKEIKDNSTVVVACSGGSDSMCLLSLVCDVANYKNLKVVVAHVNHKLRGESDLEEEMVKNFSDKHNCIFEITRLNEFKTEKFSEDIARKKRYAFFEEIVNKYNAKYLLTAHHGDDLVETILMRLTRGSNLKGYMGIRPISKKNNYILMRPLLAVSKDDILKYLKEKEIHYAIDMSNYSTKYTRNRYRKNALKFLKKENANIHKKYLQFSNELEEYNNFVNEYILKNNFIVGTTLDLGKIKNESLFIKRKAIEVIVRNIQNDDYFDISNAQMNEILKLMDGANKSIDLNNNYKCVKEYECLKIIKEYSKNEEYNLCFDNNVSYNNWQITRIETSVKDDNNIIRLNSDEISFPLIARNRKDGDKIEIKNLNGSKKIKDIYIDEKISKEKRDLIPIITDSDNNIIWIPGVKKSKFAKDKSEKYDIIFNYEVINK